MDERLKAPLDKEQWKLLDDIHSFRVPRLIAPGANHAVLAEAGYIEYHMEGGTVVITVLDAGIEALASRVTGPTPDVIEQVMTALEAELKAAEQSRDKHRKGTLLFARREGKINGLYVALGIAQRLSGKS